jgi:hypothetical protein
MITDIGNPVMGGAQKCVDACLYYLIQHTDYCRILLETDSLFSRLFVGEMVYSKKLIVAKYYFI